MIDKVDVTKKHADQHQFSLVGDLAMTHGVHGSFGIYSQCVIRPNVPVFVLAHSRVLNNTPAVPYFICTTLVCIAGDSSIIDWVYSSTLR